MFHLGGSLLKDADERKIKREVPKATNRIIDSTVARLYVAYPDPIKWTYTGLSGAICLVDDLVGHTFYLKLVDIEGNRGVLWDQELYVGFQYNQDRTYFHSFELEDCLAGLLFESKSEAAHFLKRMNTRKKHASKETAHNDAAIPRQKAAGSAAGPPPPAPPPAPHTSGGGAHRLRGKQIYYDQEPPVEWRGLYRDLANMGITEDMIASNTQFIKDFIRNQGGPLVGLEPPLPIRYAPHNYGVKDDPGSVSTASETRRAPPPPPPPPATNPSMPPAPPSAPTVPPVASPFVDGEADGDGDIDRTSTHDHSSGGFISRLFAKAQHGMPETTQQEEPEVEAPTSPASPVPPSTSRTYNVPPAAPYAGTKVSEAVNSPSSVRRMTSQSSGFDGQSKASTPAPVPPRRETSRRNVPPPPPSRKVPPPPPARRETGSSVPPAAPPRPPKRPSEAPSSAHTRTPSQLHAPPPPSRAPEVPSLPSRSPEAPPLPSRAPGVPHSSSNAPEAPPLPLKAPEVPPPPSRTPAAPPLPSRASEAPPLPSKAPEAPPLPSKAPEAPPLPSKAPEAPPLPSKAPEAPPLPSKAPEAPPLPSRAPEAPPLPAAAPPLPGRSAPSAPSAPPAPPSAPPSAPPVPPAPPASGGAPPPPAAGNPGMGALLASIQQSNISQLKKVDKSHLEKPSVLLQEAKGEPTASSSSGGGDAGGMASALAAALQSRKGKVLGSDDEDEGDDDWD